MHGLRLGNLLAIKFKYLRKIEITLNFSDSERKVNKNETFVALGHLNQKFFSCLIFFWKTKRILSFRNHSRFNFLVIGTFQLPLLDRDEPRFSRATVEMRENSN